MRVALLGGTGDIGEGLALRIGHDTDHTVVIGSRDAERASEAATAYEQELATRGVETAIEAGANPAAADGADVVVAGVPAYYLSDTIDAVADQLAGAILVSPAVGMKRDDDGLHYNPPGVGSVTQLAAGAAPDDVPVVGAFHNLAAGRLANLDADLGWDVPVVGDDESAKATVIDLADDIVGLSGLDAGGLANASEVEAVTPLLINIATNNEGLHDLGVSFQ